MAQTLQISSSEKTNYYGSFWAKDKIEEEIPKSKTRIVLIEFPITVKHERTNLKRESLS